MVQRKKRAKARAVPPGASEVAGVDCLDEPYERPTKAVALMRLREAVEQHCSPEFQAWAREKWPHVWPRPMRQMEMFE